MNYRPKVKNASKQVKAILKFIKPEEPEIEDLWYNPTLDQYWLEYSPNLEVYYADDFYQVQPILVSEKEPINIGDLVYHKQMFKGIGATGIYKAVEKRANEDFKFIYLKKPSIHYYATKSPKILALPQHLSNKHLVTIIKNSLKEGDEVLIKYDKGGYRNAVHMDSGADPDPEGIYLDKEGHIVLSIVEPSKEEAAKQFANKFCHPEDEMIVSRSMSDLWEDVNNAFEEGAEWAAENNYKGE